MLNEFVEKVLIHERDRKGSRQTTQEIEVYFNFIGRFVPPEFIKEPTPEELEEQVKIEARKDRLHQNYLRRKENGKYQAYADSIKDRLKQEMDEKKEIIRAEDIARGAFVPVAMMPKLEPQRGVCPDTP